MVKLDNKIVIDAEAPTKTGIILGLLVGLIGAVCIGFYIYNKKNRDDDPNKPEGGADDNFKIFFDQELE